MVQKEFNITNPNGLHTRTGNDFVKIAKQYSCGIEITKGDKTADAKSLLKIMKVNIIQGDSVTITCTGPDEAQALDNLEKLLLSFNEQEQN